MAERDMAPDQVEEDLASAAQRHWRLRYPLGDAAVAVLALGRAQDLVSARINALLKSLDLTLVRMEMLGLLVFAEDGAMPLGKIGEWLNLHPTSASNHVERLRAQGYVRRTPHPTDKRTVLVQITDSGREVFDTAVARLIPARFGLGDLTHRDMVDLVDILRKLPLD